MARKIIHQGFLLVVLFLIFPFLTYADQTIAWDASPDDITGYRIYFSGKQGGPYSENKNVGNVTQYPLSNIELEEGKLYYLVVRAYSDAGESENSNEISCITEDKTPPVPPEGITAESQNGNIHLEWTANSETDHAGYMIYYGTASRNYGPGIPVENITSYNITGLVAGNTYYLSVAAVDTSQNESGFSLERIVELKPAPDISNPSIVIQSPESTNYSTNASTISISGVATDNVDVVQISWENSQGGSGNAEGLSNWTIADIPLFVGENEIVVTASDSAGNKGTALINVVYNVPDIISPSIVISLPTNESTYETDIATITLAGTALDNVGLSLINWVNLAGESGTAVGTDTWSIASVDLMEGENEITLTAVDEAGNQGSAKLVVTYIPPDIIGPEVIITSHSTGSVFETENSAINLSGTAGDNIGVSQVAWANSNGGSGIANGTESWTVSLDSLVEGENVITVVALDDVGNQGSESLTVIFSPPDVTKPEVKFTSPVAGGEYETNESVITFKGTALDDTGITKLEWHNSLTGESGPAIGAADWRIPQMLIQEGTNIITVTAVDAAGNESEASLNVIYIPPDTQGPSVYITSPTIGNTYQTDKSTVDLLGDSYDNVGVVKLIWSSPLGSGTVIGIENWSVADVALNEGENDIKITAEDAAGNIGEWFLTITYTPPDIAKPDIAITSPTTGNKWETDISTFDLSGTASDNTNVNQVRWANSLGGNGTASGTTMWSVSKIILKQGDNLITVTARDDAGNEESKVLSVVYTMPDTESPEVRILSPADSDEYETDQTSINISGSALDNIGVIKVTWANSGGGGGNASGTLNWSISNISLKEGNNTITVTALDLAGNTTSKTLLVKRGAPAGDVDTTSPTISMSSPTSKTHYFTRRSTISLLGSAFDEKALAMVSWKNSKGGSGIAKGTTTWSISSIRLAKWWNKITITAVDFSGNSRSIDLIVFCWIW